MDDHAASQVNMTFECLQAFVIGTDHIGGPFEGAADADADTDLQELLNLGFNQFTQVVIVFL
ncbi:hypothetical protein D3C73_1499160 [compost metagenome]